MLLLVGVVGLGVGFGSMTLNAGAPADPPPAQVDKPMPDDASGPLTYKGRVLSLDGKPVAGAKVWISGLKPGVIEFVPRTTTGKDGTYEFTVRRDEFGDKGRVPPSRSPPEKFVYIGVSADGLGTTSEFVGQAKDRDNLTIWLPPEEVVKGRVVDLQGKPVEGVKASAYIRYGRKDKDRKPIKFDAEDEAGAWTLNVAPYEEPVLTDKDGASRCGGSPRTGSTICTSPARRS